MNAENAPKLRQSDFVCGLTKLNAKKIKITELSITRVQSPYEESLCIKSLLNDYAGDQIDFCHLSSLVGKQHSLNHWIYVDYEHLDGPRVLYDCHDLRT